MKRARDDALHRFVDLEAREAGEDEGDEENDEMFQGSF